MLLVSSSIDDDGTSRDDGVGAITTLFFVGVERGRDGRERFGGGGVDEDGGAVPLTTAVIVSEIARKIFGLILKQYVWQRSRWVNRGSSSDETKTHSNTVSMDGSKEESISLSNSLSIWDGVQVFAGQTNLVPAMAVDSLLRKTSCGRVAL